VPARPELERFFFLDDDDCKREKLALRYNTVRSFPSLLGESDARGPPGRAANPGSGASTARVPSEMVATDNASYPDMAFGL
jgi:hypothetical protein